MLPFEAFHAEADKGHLIGAFCDDVLVGYVVFRIAVKTRRIGLTQLCVSAGAQRGGYAAGLLAFLCHRFPGNPGIVALCREDYAATNAWPKLGFSRTGGRPGRSKAGHLLVQWWRPILEQTLFTFESEGSSRPAAALDTNVFRDLYEPRPQHVESMALLDGWLDDEVDFVVTSELETEINRQSTEIPSLVGTVQILRKISKAYALWNPLVISLRELLSESGIGEADLRQLAQAAVGGARFFVTRDGPILNRADDIEALAAIRVVSPSTLLLILHAQLNEGDYQAAAVLETQLVLKRPTTVWVPAELRSLADSAVDESASRLVRVLTDVAAGAKDGARLWSIENPDGSLVAVAGRSIEGNLGIVPALRVRSGPNQLSFARQLIHQIRSSSVSIVSGLRFTGNIPDYLGRALVAEGFRHGPDGWEARCERGILRSADQFDSSSELSIGELRASAISEYEKFCWPTKLISGSTPTYIVPVQAHWARGLFGQEPGQQSLLPRPDGLGLAREHVYYRSVVRSVEWPARLLWFVTGGGNNGGFRAVSWLDEVVSARPRALFKRFGSQGIYSEGDVKGAVRKAGGEVSAMLFSRTEPFQQAISLKQAKAMFPIIGSNQFLRTTRKVDEHMFEALYRLGVELP
jgi:hypothetical protein